MSDQTTRLNTALAGRYRIERHIGDGGMASVYLCEDLKHDRKVALKLLKPELAAVLGADRFVVEIKTTASLQHPHILPLFDSGTADGFLFYVMPFIEGETLRDKLNRETQLGVDDAVRIAREVLDALEYAHQHGIVHRDIKPENILLHGGHAMVADFGIALAVSAAAGGRMTETGLSLGTPHYMSPEQATAEKEITARSDVYSLGSVLYEMLAGEPPHTAGSAQAVIMKIIADPARPVQALRKNVPPNVAAAVATSLEKLPADRFESARAFADALGNRAYTHATFSGAATRRATGVRPYTRPLIATSVLVAAALAVALWAWIGRSWHEPPRPSVRFFVTGDSTRSVGEAVAISPDGRTIVFLGRANDGPSLFVQRLSELEAKPIAGTSDATADALFFAPDGQAIAFSTSRSLKRVRLDGSDLAVVATTDLLLGGAWGPDGTIVFSSLPNGVLKRVNALGGDVTDVRLREGDKKQRFLHSPRFLPGGRSILCVEGWDVAGSVGVLDLGSGDYRVITRGYSPGYSRGFLLYATPDGSLMAQRFDPARRDTLSSPERVIEGIAMADDILARYDLSDSGSIVFRPRESGDVTLALYDADATKRILMRGRRFWAPRISPEGRTIVFGSYEKTANNNADLWTYDLRTGTDQRLTTGGQTGRNFNDPVWSRDGRRVAFDGEDSVVSARVASTNFIYTVPADGTGRPQVIAKPVGTDWPTDWTPDDKYIVYVHLLTMRPSSIWMVSSDGKGEAHPLVEATFDASGGRVSPDGHWLAYQSTETGQIEVYVQPFPGPGRRVRVSTAGGSFPSWTRDGRELVYETWERQRQLVGVELKLGGDVAIGARRVLQRDANTMTGTPLAPYDVTSDGRRIVVVTAPTSPNRLAVVLDLLTSRKD